MRQGMNAAMIKKNNIRKPGERRKPVNLNLICLLSILSSTRVNYPINHADSQVWVKSTRLLVSVGQRKYSLIRVYLAKSSKKVTRFFWSKTRNLK